MTDATTSADKKAEIKIAQGRSPAYPYLTLREALDLTEKISAAGATRTTLPPETVYSIWRMGPQSSGSRQSLAALNQYGLVDYIGRGDERKIKLSELALKIVLDKLPNSPERAMALRQAALAPQVNLELWEKYGRFLPADVVLETVLARDLGYNAGAARAIIRQYRDTFELVGLDKPENEPDLPSKKSVDKSPSQGTPDVGDLVNVEIGGVLQFPQPVRVRAVQEHDGQKWVFVDGSESGILAESTIVHAKAADVTKPPGTVSPPRFPEVPHSTARLGAGEREWARGSLSKDTSYRLIVTGELGAKEIGKLIRLLQAQQAVLAEDEEVEE